MGLKETSAGKKPNKISKQYRNSNVLIFMFAVVLVMGISLIILQNITKHISKDYASLYSSNTASLLGSYLKKETSLVKKAAHSRVVMDWFADEFNARKKAAALEELVEIIGVMYSDNIYLGIHKSLNEYNVGENFTVSDLNSSYSLDKDSSKDRWYFDCIEFTNDYKLNADVDKILQRKRIWINHKVIRDGATLGVICSGLDISKLAESLFAKYDSKHVRGVIIDERGVVQMDSESLGNDDFIQFGHEYRAADKFTDPSFLSALGAYLENIHEFFEAPETIAVQLSAGFYDVSTIASIEATNWSAIFFYDSSALFSIKWLYPMFIGMVVIFIAYAFISGYVSFRLLFKPIQLLFHSLENVRETKDAQIYGLDRDDEVGSLSVAIKDLLGKVHFDALTGIHNRRFLEEHLHTIIKTMARSNGILTVFMIDIDYFKKYNDTYGHGKGDECLRSVAAALTESLKRTNDIVARYGGEEFVAVLPYTDEDGARDIAAMLLKKIESLCIPHEKNDAAGCVTVSIGITTGEVTHKLAAKDYFERADSALYAAKAKGRNRCSFEPM